MLTDLISIKTEAGQLSKKLGLSAPSMKERGADGS